MSNARTLASTINSSSEIVVPSGGINFGTSTDGTGTVTSGVMNDYEEGTFTYTLPTSGGGSFTARSGYTTGYYTKIGRTVLISLKFESQGSSSPSGNLQFAGLPFSTASSPSGGVLLYVVPILLRGTTGTSASFFLSISYSSTTGTFVKLNTDGSYATLTVSDISSGASGYFEGTLQFTYVTD